MVVVEIPLRTVSEANAHAHWRTRWARTRAQRLATGLSLARTGVRASAPANVVLTRMAPSTGLDSDNLVSAFKAVRDAVAEWLGVDDRDTRVTWQYRQERTPRGVWAVRIQIEQVQEQEATGT